MVVKCMHCGHFRKHHSKIGLACPTDKNVESEGAVSEWRNTSYELSPESQARVEQSRVPREKKEEHKVHECSICGFNKSAHKPVTRNCPTEDFEGWRDSTFQLPVPVQDEDPVQEKKPIAKQEKAIATAPKSEPVVVANDGEQLFNAINNQITSMLTNHPEVEVSEIISLEKPRSITLKFSRAQ